MSTSRKNDATAPPKAGEAIGRPSEWNEERYAAPGANPGESVVRKPGEVVTPEQPVSTPVTQEDYRKPDANR